MPAMSIIKLWGISLLLLCSIQMVSSNAPNILRNGSFELGLQNWSWTTRGGGPDGYVDDVRLKSLDPRPQIVTTQQAPDGNRVLLYEPPTTPDSAFYLSSRPYELRPAAYTLTAYLDVAGNVTVQIAGSQLEVAPADGWQKVELHFEVDEATGPVAVLVLGSEAGGKRYLMDSFSLTTEDYDYPDYPVEVGLASSAADQVLFRSEDKALIIRALARQASSGQLHYRVEDAWGQKVAAGKLSAELKPGQVYEHTLGLAINHTGHYRVLAQFIADEEPASLPSELLLAVIPDRQLLDSVSTGADSRFGCLMEDRPHLISLARAIGVRWVFCNPPLFTKWFCAEPRPGQWKTFDRQIKMYHNAGIHLCGNLADPPFWATNPGDTRASGPWPNNRFPANWTDWDNYVRTTVSHYYPDIIYWALWNEPDHPAFLALDEDEEWVDKYQVLLQRTYSVIKQVEADSKLVGGTVTNPGSLTRLMMAGAGRYMDVGSFHLSSWTPQSYTRHTAEERGLLHDADQSGISMQRLQMAMKNANTIVPVWDTEMHCTQANIEREFVTQPDPPYDPQKPVMSRLDAAAAIPRMFISEWAAGVEKSFYWLLADFRSSLEPRADKTMLEWDRSPGAAVVTYAVLTKLLGDARFVKWEQTQDTLSFDKPTFWTFHFEKPTGRMRVIWSDQDVAHQLTLPVEGNSIMTWDMFGVELPAVNSKSGIELENTVQLAVDRCPVYLLDNP